MFFLYSPVHVFFLYLLRGYMIPNIYYDKNNPNKVFLSVVQLVTPVTPYPFGGEKKVISGILFIESWGFQMDKLGL